MRLRDLRWYILASVIIIISYAAIAFSYYTSIKSGKVEKSMKAIAMEVTENTNDMIQDRINDMYYLFKNDSLNDLTNYEGVFNLPANQPKVYNNFNFYKRDQGLDKNANIIYAPKDDIEGRSNINDSADKTPYFYFHKETDRSPAKEGHLVVSISIEKLLTVKVDKEADKGFSLNSNVIIFDYSPATLGLIRYTNIKDIECIHVNKRLDSILGSAAIDGFTDGICNRIYNIGGVDYVFAAVPFTNTTAIALLIPTTDAILGQQWILTQAWIFFICTVVVVAMMLGLLVLGCLKASRLLRADRHAVEATSSIVIRVDVNGKVIFTNKTFKKMFGTTMKLLDIDGFIDVATNEPIMKTIKAKKSFECKVESEEKVHYLHLSPLYISRSYYLMGNEITTDYKARIHLENMSGKNEYTKCDNGFMLANQYQKILENNVGYDIAFIEYNIHKYEEIVSIFGRSSYVDLLKQFLGILRSCYRDLGIYHMTESKFMVVLPNKSIDDVTKRVIDTLKEFRKPIHVKENNIYVNTKVVVYNVTQDIMDETTIYDIRNKLDLAYRNMSQLSSKDYIVYDPLMDSVILQADVMEQDIEVGLENDEFEMYLQPQFDIVNKKIAGFESLIRWNNPKYRDKSPQAFIELAEQRGHMLDIGRFVIKESFKLAKKLEPYKVSISVNVSPVQLLQVGFVTDLIEAAHAAEVNPRLIAIEITETLLMENFQLINEKLKLLKAEGFTIHLDDFCTGYSSMRYLKDLPVDTIKIDKDFTKFIETSKVHESISRTICNLANSLGLGIVCEGVENEVQAEMMKKMGCRIIQGFLIGKAMPFNKAVELIEKYNKTR